MNAWDPDPRDPDDLAAAARHRAARPGLGGRASVALLCLLPVGVGLWWGLWRLIDGLLTVCRGLGR
jgi:hypothetical protein